MLYDIVIPVGPNDYHIIKETIEYTKVHAVDYRNIYIVSAKEFHIDDCIYVPESIFPFSLHDIHQKEACRGREGWYLQQLIKLYASHYILGILDNYLVLDSDVYLLHPIEFMRDGKPLYATGSEYHVPYFDHMARLHPMFVKVTERSGICHHMMFTKQYINEIFAMVENQLVENPQPFWKQFIEVVTERGSYASGASEYELYFNFMLMFHPEEIIIRELTWDNLNQHQWNNLYQNYQVNTPHYDFVAVHHYMRTSDLSQIDTPVHTIIGNLHRNTLHNPSCNKPIVSVNIAGGLGNQLFEIAAAYAYAKKEKGDLQILHIHECGNRPVYWESLLQKVKPYLVSSLPTLEQWHQGPATIYKSIDPLPPSGIYLNGHLQTSKYFYDEDTKNDIRELFRPSSALEEEVKAKYKYLWENKDRVVVVHARRTDYLKNQIMIDTHGPLSSAYYKEAIQRMKEKVADPIWVLTSDDNRFWIEIESDLGVHAPIILMNESDIHSFVLLQQFNHYIMSNSTFIWWCVWMANAKHVIAPSKWFGPLGPYPYEDIYELHWIRI